MMKIEFKKLIALMSLALVIGIGFVQTVSAESSIADQIIVSVTEARIRTSPSLKAGILGATQIGTVFDVKGTRGTWNQVIHNGRRGWISSTITQNFYNDNRGVIYQELADKYLSREKLDFDSGAEVFNFLTNIRYDVDNENIQAALGLRRLRILHRTLEAIPFDSARPWKEDEVSVYKTFVTTNESEVMYSEPAGQWFVDSGALWKLREKYHSSPIADDIAWEAANNPLPGECEGFITCYLPLMTMTYGEYLKLYPNGKFSKKVLESVTSSLNTMAGNDGGGYEEPIESEYAEFTQNIKELRAIIAKVSNPESRKALGLLDKLASKYK